MINDVSEVKASLFSEYYRRATFLLFPVGWLGGDNGVPQNRSRVAVTRRLTTSIRVNYDHNYDPEEDQEQDQDYEQDLTHAAKQILIVILLLSLILGGTGPDRHTRPSIRRLGRMTDCPRGS
jgi:hypothetical protein